MKIKKALWYKNADSPVIFMVDDLANVWIDLNNNGQIDLGEDWGHGMNSPNSAFRYLNENILKDFPEIKTTFFVPLNRVPLQKNHKYNAHFGPVDETEELTNFFRSIHQSEKYEVAYHGITHGISANNSTPFIHEWQTYKTLDEALEKIKRGKEFFYRVFESYPKGGKYCGYKRNSFSDISIDKSGFFWWCRVYSRNLTNIPDSERFRMNYFGKNKVVDIPSTLSGNIFNFAKPNIIKVAVKKVLKRNLITEEDIVQNGIQQIEDLLNNRFVISVQEHMSPARTDGKLQITNIFDDKKSLLSIFNHIKNRNVWYATATEIAEYFEVFSNTSIIQTSKYNFKLNYNGKNVINNFLTIVIEEITSHFEIKLPDNSIYNMIEFHPRKNSAIINKLPIQNGNYQIIIKK